MVPEQTRVPASLANQVLSVLFTNLRERQEFDEMTIARLRELADSGGLARSEQLERVFRAATSKTDQCV